MRDELVKSLDVVNVTQQHYLRALNDLIKTCNAGDKELERVKAELAALKKTPDEDERPEE